MTAQPDLVIKPPARWSPINVRELWEFRDLLLRFAQRDVTLRYRQTALGVIWVVLQPLMAAGVFTFVFGRVADLPSEGVPYFAFSYAGMLGWNLFNSTVGKFSGSLVGNAGLVSKIFFPRLVLPLSTWGSTLLDFTVAMGMMVVVLLIAGVAPGIGLLALPIWVVLALLIGGGIGLMAAALMVKYRDVGYVMPVMTQMLLYGTPIAYSLSRVPESALTWVKLNPLTGVMVGFRWSLLDTSRPDGLSVTSSAVAGVSLFVVGATVFTRMERQFADVI
ncbi:MAG: ABC transporter permease [Acidimicrobiia bacterium]